ncbi:MAG: DUF4440 domain-containing protein [Nitrososphaerales archaeon]
MNTSQRRTAVAIVLVMSLIVARVTLFNLPAAAQTNEGAAKEVIAIAKAQWKAQIEKKAVATVMQNVADEYTQFGPATPTRTDGKALNMRLGEAFFSGSGGRVAAEMANEKVQVYGDVAILSYNFIGMDKDKDGKVEPVFAKSTRVYVKKDGKWMLVHANFAPVK